MSCYRIESLIVRWSSAAGNPQMIDQTLISDYVSRRDPAAFREIVDRHGPAVLRVCRRLLRDDHEAEDAFQATFLVLVRRAPSLRDPELLGRWLTGVARLVASRSRNRGLRQSDRERRWALMRPTSFEQDWPLLEIRRAVREELEQLPATYREPLSLCYLEGLTHEEAARRLACPVGTVKVRLVRARRLLRDRLDRKGIALSVAFLLFLFRRDASASALDPASSPAGTPAEASAEGPSTIEGLTRSTLEAMSLAASGEVAVLESRFPRAVALSRGIGRLGVISRRGFRFALLLALAAFASGGLALARQVTVARGHAAASARLSKVLNVDCRQPER